MDIKRLGHLIALADELHFARAAERVHLSQPAFSRSIQALEREVGQQLFDRDTGDVKPTPAGQFLIERARRLLFDAGCLRRDMALYGESRLGDTAVGAGPFPAATLMLRAIPLVRQQYPEVRLRVEVSNWQLLLERLLSEDIEFFVSDTRDLPPDPKLIVTSLGRQSGRLYARAGHPLSGRTCEFAEAWSYGVAATKLPVTVKAVLGELLGLPRGESLPMALECDDVTLLRRTAMSTDTVLASTDAAVEADVIAGELVALEVQGLPPLATEMGIVMLRNRTPSPAARRVMETVRTIPQVT